MAYIKNKWEIFDPELPEEEQPDSFITKRKLDNIEEGIEAAHELAEKAAGTLEIGEVVQGDEASAEIVDGKLNLVLPKGEKGYRGNSAYEIWLTLEGNEGKTLEEFIISLKG